jgi:hypothetical protein
MEKDEFEGKFTNSPLTPSILIRLGVIKPEALSESFKKYPPENQMSKFIIWTTDGYINKKNRILGELKLSNDDVDSEKFQLNVEQIYYNAGNVKHQITVSMRCLNNPIASPVFWEMECRFDGGDHINFSETVSVNDDKLNISINNKSFEKKVSPNFTSDWSLFSAITQFPFTNSKKHEFDLLEGLKRFRKNHRLIYKGKSTLHHFQQTGAGILPYDYWLNDERQLMMVITGNRAYIPVELVAANKTKQKKRGETNG